MSALQDTTPIIKAAPFTVVREIILSESKYRRFQADLLAETPFIAARTHLTGYSEKSGRFRCLLVSTRKRQDGILVDSEGYAYARYAAYVRDKRELDLAGVPRDNLNLKARERCAFFFSAGEGIEIHLPLENGRALRGDGASIAFV